MSQITVSASISLTTFQKDFLIKSGFVILANNTFMKNVKDSELYIVIGVLSSKNIPFNIKLDTVHNPTKPCIGCKK